MPTRACIPTCRGSLGMVFFYFEISNLEISDLSRRAGIRASDFFLRTRPHIHSSRSLYDHKGTGSPAHLFIP